MPTALRVLIVEDSEDDARLIERQLETGGYRPTTLRVDSVETMTRALDSGSWDAVVADYRLPGFSALAGLALLRERGLDLPYIVVSGSIGEDIAVSAMKAGAHDYIMKGNLARLVPAVEREIREAACRRERRLAEERLRASEARYRVLFEHAYDAIAVWDEAGRLVDANLAYAGLLGRSREELLGTADAGQAAPAGAAPAAGAGGGAGEAGRAGPEAPGAGAAGGPARAPAAAGCPLAAPAAELSELWGRLREAGRLLGEFTVRRRDGAERIVEANAMRVAPGLSMAILRDMTERKSLEWRLAQAQRMESIGTLAGGIAHDFNNILTGIGGYAELALMHLSPVHPLWEDLQRIRRQVEHAATLTRQLLAFSRRQILERSHVDLNRVVTELQTFFRRVIGEHIELRIAAAPALDTAYVDPVQVEQVLMSLCINARDAMPGGGRLTIETANVRIGETDPVPNPCLRPGRYVRVRVSDTGLGMDEATIRNIFDPFFTTKGPGRGSGLGLAMVYGIVKQHEGAIHVQSEPGKGSTFSVYFKAAAAAPQPAGHAEPEAHLRGSETVLLAEDDPMVRELVVRTLAAQGYEVLAAADGEEAVRLFEAHGDRIAAAVLDAVMPKMGGRAVYEALHARKPALRFLVVSGYSVNSIDERFLRDSGVQFVQKPFSPAELVRRVRELLDTGAGRRP